MADSTLDMLRNDALVKRIKGITNGNHIVWSSKDIAVIRDYVMALPERIVRGASTAVRNASVVCDPAAVQRNLADAGLAVRREMKADDFSFVVPITSKRTYLVNDQVDPAGVDRTDFNKNPAVLDSHNASVPPVAISSPPWMSSGMLMAIAKFPQPGVSADSDRIAAAVRASLLKGISIGFQPIRWSFSKDPNRPLGIDYHSVKLLEFSWCSLPCNQDCIVIGAVSGGKEFSLPDPGVTARQQRIAEAAQIRRQAYGVDR